MKKPLTIPDELQPRNITRADLVMTEGFGLEVDGRMKTVFPTLEAAQKRARDVKAEVPMLQVNVYDAAGKRLLEFSPTERREVAIAIGAGDVAPASRSSSSANSAPGPTPVG